MPLAELDGAIIGRRVRVLRQARKLSLRVLAQRAGVSHTAIYLLEHGETSSPGSEFLGFLAKPLGVPVRLLMDGSVGLLGSRVRSAREEQGLSITDLALRAELDPEFLASVESGREPISLEAAAQLAAVLGVAIEALTGPLSVFGDWGYVGTIPEQAALTEEQREALVNLQVIGELDRDEYEMFLRQLAERRRKVERDKGTME